MVRLTVQDAECPGQVIDVYLDLSCGPYTHGLIAGAALEIHQVQRKVSRCDALMVFLKLFYSKKTNR